MDTIYEVKPPQSLADVGRWLNEWGDSEKHDFTKAEREAYKQAISDAYDYFDKFFPDWPKLAEGREEVMPVNHATGCQCPTCRALYALCHRGGGVVSGRPWIVEYVDGEGEWREWSRHRVYGRALVAKARLDRLIGVRYLTRLRKNLEVGE